MYSMYSASLTESNPLHATPHHSTPHPVRATPAQQQETSEIRHDDRACGVLSRKKTSNADRLLWQSQQQTQHNPTPPAKHDTNQHSSTNYIKLV